MVSLFSKSNFVFLVIGFLLQMSFFDTVETPIEPECRVDRDCPAKMACIEDRCQNPCLTSNPCGRNQVCTVEDSYDGRRTVGCTCPPDQVSAGNNLCKTGRLILEASKTRFWWWWVFTSARKGIKNVWHWSFCEASAKSGLSFYEVCKKNSISWSHLLPCPHFHATSLSWSALPRSLPPS